VEETNLERIKQSILKCNGHVERMGDKWPNWQSAYLREGVKRRERPKMKREMVAKLMMEEKNRTPEVTVNWQIGRTATENR
jgi:hypothetical protein